MGCKNILNQQSLAGRYSIGVGILDPKCWNVIKQSLVHRLWTQYVSDGLSTKHYKQKVDGKCKYDFSKSKKKE